MYRLIPISLVLLILVIWQLVIQVGDVPVYLMPSPDRIFITLVTDSSSLIEDLAYTSVSYTHLTLPTSDLV